MAWRFVEQPNGLLARFSSVVDDITEYDMNDEEAIELAIEEYDAGRKTAREKVAKARAEGKTRYQEMLRIIERVHGKQRARECAVELSRQEEEHPPSAQAEKKEFLDVLTGNRLIVTYDIPEHPKVTLIPPEGGWLVSEVEEVNAAIGRLLVQAGLERKAGEE